MNPLAEALVVSSKAAPSSARPQTLLRGEYPALVFSGDRYLLGELPGEMTASTPFKFALEDPRLDVTSDFAKSPGMPLPLWPADRIVPHESVCFVLSDSAHPALRPLKERGAREYEHYVVADEFWRRTDDAVRLARLDALLKEIEPDGPIILLGYGDQGGKIASHLRDELNIEPTRITVIDGNKDSRDRAERDGHTPSDVSGSKLDGAFVIYSPLMRYERLYGMFKQAQNRNCCLFDNSMEMQNSSHFRSRGCVLLDAAADRAVRVTGTNLHLRDHGLPIASLAVVREDKRSLAGHVLPQLTAFHRAIFDSAADEFDLAPPGSADRLAGSTFRGLSAAFVSLRDRPDTAIFAARSLCERLWPEATAQVLPARCGADLGSTRFERIIKRHLDGAEIIAASQSSVQQVTLGIVAAHYAADSPIVEIGSALGGSGVIMAAATDQHRPLFYSIDPETATRHVMRWGFEQQQQLDRLHQIIETSDRASASLTHLHGKAGLVFIDGLHTEEATAADFINYAPLVTPGGAMLIHDVEPARYSVLRVVLERVLPDGRFVPMCLVDGLLVLQRRK